MKTVKALAILLLAVVGVLGVWAIGSRLSTDAIGMGVGMIFGVLSGIPAALLILAAPGARRQADDYSEVYEYRQGYHDGYRTAEQDARRLLESQATQAQLHSYIVEGRYSVARPFALIDGECER